MKSKCGLLGNFWHHKMQYFQSFSETSPPDSHQGSAWTCWKALSPLEPQLYNAMTFYNQTNWNMKRSIILSWGIKILKKSHWTMKIFQLEKNLFHPLSVILKVVINKKSKFFSHRYLIEFHETNRISHVPHLYDVVNLLK